jgi:hypothetical protein
MSLMGSRRVLLSAQATLPAPMLDYSYASNMALGGLETFTRASTGWYFSSAGVLTSAATDAARFDYDPSTARTNLALRSAQQDVSGVWTASQITVTADTVTDPLGTTTADTFTENSGATSRGTAQNIAIATNVSQTFSIYAKAGTRSWLRLMLNTGSDSVICWFNLGTGALGSTTTEGTGSSPVGAITDVGSGWYRCALTGIPSSANSGTISAYIRMATADSEFSYQGNGVGTLHVWGAQLETGSSATAYIATAASAASSATARGLLLEEARTNLWLNSAAVGSWTSLGDATITANTAVAPDGTTTADLITMAANGSVPGNTLTLAASTTYTISIHVKDGATAPYLRIRISTAASSLSGYFNLATGALGAFGTGMSGGRVDTLAAGWKRYSFQYLPAAGDEGSRSIVFPGVSANSSGTASGALTVWGAQVEAGAFVTSYIPTTGASATRAVDVCTVPTSSVPSFSATEGTLYAAFRPLGVSGTQTAIYLDDGTSNERMGIRASSAALAGVVVDGGVSQAAVSGGTLTAAATKAAMAYKLDDIGLAVNGVAGTADTSATLPTVTTLLIGTRLTGSESLSGWYTRVSYYNRRIADRFLSQITT